MSLRNVLRNRFMIAMFREKVKALAAENAGELAKNTRLENR